MNVQRFVCLAASLVLLVAPVWATQPDADDLMRKNFHATKLSGLSGEITMTLINSRGEQRLRKMSVRSKLKGNGIDSAIMTRFLQPPDIKGSGFLQIENSGGDDDIWVYLPALGKTRRLASNNKRDSFFGTDFSYGDILLPAVEKYSHTLLRNETIDGVDCYLVESRPLDEKTRDDTGYDRKLTWVDSRNYVERKVEYYDAANSNTLLKTQLTYDVRELEPQRQRWLPLRREMTNHQSGHKTLYSFDNVNVDNSLTEGWFSARNLERR
jgi:outer membrane lipoprotein-sorting protein